MKNKLLSYVSEKIHWRHFFGGLSFILIILFHLAFYHLLTKGQLRGCCECNEQGKRNSAVWQINPSSPLGNPTVVRLHFTLLSLSKSHMRARVVGPTPILSACRRNTSKLFSLKRIVKVRLFLAE